MHRRSREVSYCVAILLLHVMHARKKAATNARTVWVQPRPRPRKNQHPTAPRIAEDGGCCRDWIVGVLGGFGSKIRFYTSLHCFSSPLFINATIVRGADAVALITGV